MPRPEGREMQAAYPRRAIDAINDLDNILYKVMNEGGNKDWDGWVERRPGLGRAFAALTTLC